NAAAAQVGDDAADGGLSPVAMQFDGIPGDPAGDNLLWMGASPAPEADPIERLSRQGQTVRGSKQPVGRIALCDPFQQQRRDRPSTRRGQYGDPRHRSAPVQTLTAAG